MRVIFVIFVVFCAVFAREETDGEYRNNEVFLATQTEDIRDIFNRAKEAVSDGLETVRTFGPIERVADFIRSARDKLRDMLRDLKPDQPLRQVDVVTPMHGWVYEIPTEFKDLTPNDIAKRTGALIDPKPGRSSSQIALEVENGKWYDPRTWFATPTPVPAPVAPPVARDDKRTVTQPVINSPLPVPATPTPEAPLPDNYLFYDAYPACKARPWDQGACGSCWAFSNSASLGYRICRKAVDAGWRVPPNFRISPQQFISCATTAVASSGNGCEGGFTTGAAQWIAGLASAELSCMASTKDNNPHKDRCPRAASCAPKWGPFTGSPNWVRLDTLPQSQIETAMMRAIYNEGPIVVSVRLPSVFMGYSGRGVFRKGPNDAWLPNGKNPDGTVIHANHALVAVGWGVEPNGDKYWVIENSWGEPYSRRPAGLRHTLKWIRGVDDCNIESQGIAAVRVNLPAADPHANDPRNECERKKPGASCMATAACTSQGRHVARGLCPGADTCCLAPGSALSIFSKKIADRESSEEQEQEDEWDGQK